MALTEGEKVTLLAILAVLMVLVLYFEMRIMRGKAKSVRKMSLRKDEAYNSILTCRSVINVLQRQGADVSEARALVDKAKYHMDRGDHETALDLCESAREELTKARPRSEGTPTGYRRTAARTDDVESVAEEIVAKPRAVPPQDSYSGSRLEVQGGPNYLVAKFEINTAKEEVAKASASGRDATGASDMVRKAQAEFDAGNYAKALSLAVKAKKAASPGTEETIPLRKGEAHVAPSAEADGEASDVVDVCPSCGTELDENDAFCGSCGSKRPKERVCPSCGRAASENDRFCRKCGTRVP